VRRSEQMQGSARLGFKGSTQHLSFKGLELLLCLFHHGVMISGGFGVCCGLVAVLLRLRRVWA